MGVLNSDQLVDSLRSYLDQAVEHAGTTDACRPDHRHPFHWPPHPVSPAYHVLSSDWTGKAFFDAYGDRYEVTVATTPYGVFGRCGALWHEARGATEAEMLENLREAAEPLFKRQLCIAQTLEPLNPDPRPFKGHIRDLPFEDLLKLLYSPDRDVANDARIEIETHASLGVFGPALIEILRDNRHPHRRSAQWCVLDLFEDLPSYCHSQQEIDAAVSAMRDLIWNATDDFARTTFKAGVVLGGHLPSEIGGPVLIQCLQSPSKFGRRSAIHGLYHVVEWDPSQHDQVIAALSDVMENDPEPTLREYARHMWSDIQAGTDHVTEPLFDGE